MNVDQEVHPLLRPQAKQNVVPHRNVGTPAKPSKFKRSSWDKLGSNTGRTRPLLKGLRP